MEIRKFDFVVKGSVRGRLALVSCGAKKLPVPAPAKWLYMSGLFAVQYLHGFRHCEHVRIVSAKHGLISPDTWVHPYNHSLKDKNKNEKAEWLDLVRAQLGQRKLGGVVSIHVYAGGAYMKLLSTLPNTEPALSGNLFERMSTLSTGTRRYPKAWPNVDCMTEIYGRGPAGISFRDLRKFTNSRYSPTAAPKQYDMALHCPLHQIIETRVVSRAHGREVL